MCGQLRCLTYIGTQDVVLDGRVALTRYTGYHHGIPDLGGIVTQNTANPSQNCKTTPAGCTSTKFTSALQTLNWADGPNLDGTIDILDIADAALHFGTNDTAQGGYWAHPSYSTTTGPTCSTFGASPCDDIGVIATIAAHFGEGITKPFTPAQLTANSMDPQINPFDAGDPVFMQGTNVIQLALDQWQIDVIVSRVGLCPGGNCAVQVTLSSAKGGGAIACPATTTSITQNVPAAVAVVFAFSACTEAGAPVLSVARYRVGGNPPVAIFPLQ